MGDFDQLARFFVHFLGFSAMVSALESAKRAFVKLLLKTKRANQVARIIFQSLKEKCNAVVANKGAAIKS